MKRRLAALVAGSILLLGAAGGGATAAATRPELHLPVTLNGHPINFDVEPERAADRTFVPLRAIFEKLGATVSWDDETRTATAVRGSAAVALRVGRTEASVNGTVRALSVAPYIRNDRTMIPLRFVSEALGASVDYNPTTTAITITDPTWPPHRGGQATMTLRNRSVGPLNPVINDDTYAGQVMAMIFDPLVRVDGQLQAYPVLAESWTWSPNGRELTLFLRGGVRFQDGRVLTSRDVLATYSVYADSANPARRPGFDLLEGLDAPDEQSVRFRLRQPDGGFLHRLTLPVVGTVALAGVEFAAMGDSLNGTGPFRLAGRGVDGHGEYLSLLANPDYWGGRPYLDRLLLRVVPGSDRVDRFRQGELDAVPLRPGEATAYGAAVRSVPGREFQYIGFNLRQGPLNDLRVRQAVSLAIDRDALLKDVPGTRLLASPVLPALWGGTDLEGPAYDPGAARRLLALAGWSPGADGLLASDGHTLRLRLAYPAAGDPDRPKVAAALAAMLRSIGIQVELMPTDLADLATLLTDPNRFDLYMSGFVFDPADPVPAGLWDRSGLGPGGLNRIGWSSPAADDLLARARAATEPAERGRLFRQWAALWLGDAPGLVLYARNEQTAVSSRLHGFGPEPTDWWVDG